MDNRTDDEHIRLINADCLEAMEYIADKSIDMILCDLPYGTTQNKWDSIIPLPELWLHYNRILKSNGIIALTSSRPFTSTLVVSNFEMFRHEWIWIKNRGSNFANTVREPFKEHESVLIFSEGKWTYNKQMQERTGSGLNRIQYDFNNVTETENYGKFDRPSESKGKEMRVPSSWQKFNTEVGLHPTQKPVTLFEYLMLTYSNEGELILDNCAGSFTTAIAAINTKRNYICIEKEKKYFDVGVNRVEERNRIVIPVAPKTLFE